MRHPPVNVQEMASVSLSTRKSGIVSSCHCKERVGAIQLHRWCWCNQPRANGKLAAGRTGASILGHVIVDDGKSLGAPAGMLNAREHLSPIEPPGPLHAVPLDKVNCIGTSWVRVPANRHFVASPY